MPAFPIDSTRIHLIAMSGARPAPDIEAFVRQALNERA